MAHAQKSDFVFQRNGRVHLNRQGASVQSTTGSRGVRIIGSNAGYTRFRGSVKSTGYPLHLSVSLFLPLPCVTVCHRISTGVYISSITPLYSLHHPPYQPHILSLTTLLGYAKTIYFFNPFQSNFSANRILPSSYLF
jgi:hypothetical protein